MLINELFLKSINLDSQKTFYANALGLELLNELQNSFTIKLGASKLTFKESETQVNPYYHFAINIPANQIDQAIKWLQPKVRLIEHEDSPLINFPNWNAHSIYFYDPAGNIVELIARHSLNNSSNEPFSSASLLNISEVGMPVESVNEFIKFAETKLNEKLWWGNLETFAAIGDEEGLLIAVTTKRNWFPTEKPCNVFPLQVKIKKSNSSFETLKFIPYEIIPTLR